MPNRNFFSSLIILLLVSCASTIKHDSSENIRWLSFEGLVQSLRNQPPMRIGFDVDDTVLFSSPGFYYGMNKYSPGSAKFMAMDTFWVEMNNTLDQFSIPKDIARRLIKFHQERGDTIYFITARPATPTEKLTEILAKTFDLKNPNKVIFTGFKRGKNFKIAPIKRLQIRLFYGDSDSDIEAAQVNGARAIRIMRAGNTTYKPLPDYGILGEEVLKDSQF